LELPYHFQRRPRQYGPLNILCQYSPLISRDYLQMAMTYAQAIAEIRSLSWWLLAEGCPAVALWGYSRGAADAGMTVCRDARLAAVVMACPPARCEPYEVQLAVRPSIRGRLQSVRGVCESLKLTAMNLTTTRPAIPREKILLIEGIHDLICPKDDIEDLWHSWGKPDIWRLPCGHVRICCGGVTGLPGRVLRWLSPRLNAPPAQARPTDAAR